MTALDLAFQAQLNTFRLDVRLKTDQPMLLVCGENGSGKSSLLRCLLGLIPLTDGYISIGASRLAVAGQASCPIEQRRLAYVPQSEGLFPHLTVLAQLRLAIKWSEHAQAKSEHVSRREQQRRLDQQITELELTTLTNRYPHELSGGQRKCVALARALVQHPRALLLDEPLSSLDVGAQHKLRNMLAQHPALFSLTKVMISHDPADVLHFPQQIAIMDNGCLSSTTSLQELEHLLHTSPNQLSPFATQLILRAQLLKKSTIPASGRPQ